MRAHDRPNTHFLGCLRASGHLNYEAWKLMKFRHTRPGIERQKKNSESMLINVRTHFGFYEKHFEHSKWGVNGEDIWKYAATNWLVDGPPLDRRVRGSELIVSVSMIVPIK